MPAVTAARRRAALRRALAAAAFAAACGLLASRAWTLVNVPGAPDDHHWVLQDFRDAIYYPVVALVHGDNPYDVVRYRAAYPVAQEFPVYSPLTLLLHLPFGMLPYQAAEALYFALTIGLTIGLAIVSLRLAGRAARPDAVLWLAALLLLSRPGHSNLLLGQSTLLAVFATLAAWHWRRARPGWAMLGMAVATYKPTFGLPLAVLLCAAGAPRVALVGGGIGAALGGLMAIGPIAAAGGVLPFLDALVNNTSATQASRQVAPLSSWLRIDAWALLARATGGAAGGLAELACSGLLLGAAALALHRQRDADDAASRVLGGGLLAFSVLLAVYHQTYDLLLLAPTATALGLGVPRALWAARPLARRLGAACAVLPFANYAATHTALDRFGVGGAWWQLVVSLNGLALLVGWTLFVALVWAPLPLRRAAALPPRAARLRGAR
ncbi:MAG: glycosyltransferase family 87 protein [Deltaproteobacteria bacterium]|nr:glycosyltransferase family 87 protein [Deltaproteobacteria bacterium]